MRRVLVVAAAAGAVAAPVAAAVPPIVFSSIGPPEVMAAHRYVIRPDGSGRRALPVANGLVSPDGRLVARAAGSENARTVEILRSSSGRVVSTIAIAGKSVNPPRIVWSPDSRRLALGVATGCYTTSYKGNGCTEFDIRVARVGDTRARRVAYGRQPAWNGDGTRLAYVRNALGDQYVFVVSASGGPERMLVPGDSPAWAPRGTRLAYNGGRGVMLLDAARRHSRRVLAHAYVNSGPIWSPDGRAVAYVHEPDSESKPWTLETVDVGSGRVRVLARTLTGGDTFLGPVAWSRDSRLLAYAADSVRLLRTSASEQVFVVPAGGGRPRQVTHELPWDVYDEIAFVPGGLDYVARPVPSGPAPELYAVQPDGTGLVRLTHDLFYDDQPAWSPDGVRLVFVRGGSPVVYPSPSAIGLWTLDTSTNAQRPLVPLRGAVVWPAWSPDGSLLAYVFDRKIAIARADGTRVRVIGTHGDPDRATWSPDGTKLAFTDRGSSELLVVNADGTGLHEVAPVSTAANAAWSPDGRWIAFGGRPTDTAQYGLWLVHPDGTGFRLVVAGSAYEAAWSPDSSQLVYVHYVSGGATTLRIAAADGSSDRALPLPVLQPFSPAWRR